MATSIIEILMRRDGVSKREATQAVEDCRSELYDALYGTSCIDPEDVLMNELGLENDYLDDLLLGGI